MTGKIGRRTVGTVEVFTPLEALVEDTATQLFANLRSLMKSTNPRIVVDMSEVGYLDSDALEGLLGCADELNERNTQLKLSAVTSTCREVFELTGIASRFQFFEGVDSAVRSYL